MNATRHVIELHDVVKTYHLGEIAMPVLKGVSLTISRGEMVAFMGASGSGKTTLLNILGCLDRPTAGRYLLEGREVSRLSRDELAMIRNGTIGFVFQSFNLLTRTSALDNVMLPLSYASESLADGQAELRARDLLEQVGLGDRLEHEPAQLSGGQQQRVAIARSLVNNPALLLADEPTGNLDSQASTEILRLIRALNRERGITVVLVTHDPGVAEHADRLIRVRDGRIEDSGRPLVASWPAAAVSSGPHAGGAP